MPVEINRLVEGWLELESDPGLFTLLLEDFGVKGIQVEEIYDLQKPLDSPVCGFIFLFRWIEERRSRRKVIDQSHMYLKDDNIVNNIFFAQQMVPNSCATHSLLSILLNCSNIHLGDTLNRLKDHTSGMNPENKGWAIGNTPELAKAHNSHANASVKRRKNNTPTSVRYSKGESFHFVSYVPINGHLFELDGLKPFPIDHGPWNEGEEWTEKFQRVITDRLGMSTGEKCNDIRFSLLAVVPDKRIAISHKLSLLKTNRQIVLEVLQLQENMKNKNMATLSSNEDKKSDNTVDDVNKLDIATEQSSSLLCTANTKETIDVEQNKDEVKEEKKCDAVQKVEVEKMTKEDVGESNEDISDSVTDKDMDPFLEERDKPSTSKSASTDQPLLIEINDDKPPDDSEKKTDYWTPLTIQTSSPSPIPSCPSSIETSSEVDSPSLNSPALLSSSKDFKKCVVIRVAMDNKNKKESGLIRKVCLEGNALPKGWEKTSSSSSTSSSPQKSAKASPAESIISLSSPNSKKSNSSNENLRKKCESTFARKDLLTLIKNLEAEIMLCEGQLKDENEKRKKYKEDDQRRTYNYDQFITTFLCMLAQQGSLADLVQESLKHNMGKK